MQVHKITLVVVDHDQLGAEEVERVLEHTKYPNRCINPDVQQIETRDIGEWDDAHPLNSSKTAPAEIARLFGGPSVPYYQAADLAALLVEQQGYNNASTFDLDSATEAALRNFKNLSTPDVQPWRVAEFWSSANPGQKVLMLAVGQQEILDWSVRSDLIRWVSP